MQPGSNGHSELVLILQMFSVVDDLFSLMHAEAFCLFHSFELRSWSYFCNLFLARGSHPAQLLRAKWWLLKFLMMSGESE